MVGYGDVYSPTSVAVYLTSVDDQATIGPHEAATMPLGVRETDVHIGLSGAFLFDVLGPKATRISAMLKVGNANVDMLMLPLPTAHLLHIADACTSRRTRFTERRTCSDAQIDPKLKLLPAGIIDWFMKHIAAQLVPLYHKQVPLPPEMAHAGS